MPALGWHELSQGRQQASSFACDSPSLDESDYLKPLVAVPEAGRLNTSELKQLETVKVGSPLKERGEGHGSSCEQLNAQLNDHLSPAELTVKPDLGPDTGFGTEEDQNFGAAHEVTVPGGGQQVLREVQFETKARAATFDNNCTSQPEPSASSYYMPGKVYGKSTLFLLDTGCTTNILSGHVFNSLSSNQKEKLRPVGSSATLADGSSLVFFGQLTLKGKLRDEPFESEFLLAHIKEDVIIGMPFLEENQCTLSFVDATLSFGGKELTCTDRRGRDLTSRVNVVREVVLPALSEIMLQCEVQRPSSRCGLVEGTDSNEMLVAASLHTLDEENRLFVRCMNTSTEEVKLIPGTSLGRFSGVSSDEILDAELNSSGNLTGSPNLTKCGQLVNHIQTSTLPDHLQQLYLDTHSSVADEACRQRVADLLTKYQDVFSKGDSDTGRTHLAVHDIPLKPGTRPIKQPPRRQGAEKEAEITRQVEDLCKRGLIEPADSPWSSPVVLVRRKDMKWRFCVDYRALNNVTCQDAYPLPRIDESLDALCGSKYFSTLDLVSGYWQVPLSPDAQEKSAFVTRNGLWKWTVLPFGLTSAPARFERLMEKVLLGLHWKTALLYLDDVIVFSSDIDTHLERLAEVLDRLRSAGLKLKPSKCELLKTHVKYLGHVVSADGVATDPEKVKDVEEWPEPVCKNDVRRFIGTVGYYRRYIDNFATIAKPLTKLTTKLEEPNFHWGPDEAEAFRILKTKLITAPILGYPDVTGTFMLDTDASHCGVGAVLSQIQGPQERVLAYYSKSLSPAEHNYCVTRKELLACVKAVKHFRPYLYGKKFQLRTDHASLIWLMKRKEPSGQIARWIELLSEFQFNISHRSGVKHGNADGMSRLPCIDCVQCHRIELRDGGPNHQEIAELKEVTPIVFQHGPTHHCIRIDHRDSVRVDNLSSLQQQANTELARIYELVKTGSVPSEQETGKQSQEFKKMASLIPLMTIGKDGVLRVRLTQNGRAISCAVCPKSIRQNLIWQTHCLAHTGINRTTARLRLQWYWPLLSGDVRRAVSSCEICQMAKRGGIKPSKTGQNLSCGRPWQTVAVDLVGQLPLTERGNRWILVLTDHFTKWQDALAIPDATAPTVAQTLDERVFCYFGLPETIHSDQGAQFEGELMHELCRIWGVNKTRTTPYNPKGNGMVERNNLVLGDSLRTTLIGQCQDQWDAVLPHLMRALRATPHTKTKETANFMMLGRETRLPDQVCYGDLSANSYSREQYALRLQEAMSEAHDLWRKRQKELRTADSEEPLQFVVGDQVLMKSKRVKKGESGKLSSTFVGPFEVVKVNTETRTYVIEAKGQRSCQNETRLKLFRPSQGLKGRAPALVEPRRGKNMKGLRKRMPKDESPPMKDGLEVVHQPARTAEKKEAKKEDTPPPVQTTERPKRERKPVKRLGID